MFRGRYEHTIDAKGRLSIPAKFRDVLKEEYDSRLVVTTLDGCLIAYPHQEWLALEEKISKLPAFNKNTRSFLRNFYSSGVDCPIDKLGRILVPQALRDYAGLTTDVMMMGIFCDDPRLACYDLTHDAVVQGMIPTHVDRNVQAPFT